MIVEVMTGPVITPPIVTVNVSNFTTTITNGQLLGTIEASTNDGTLIFSLSAESPVGAFSINASTGKISVLDSILFDFETNTHFNISSYCNQW